MGLVQSRLNRVKDPKQLAQIGIEEGIGFVRFGGTGYEAYRQIRKHDSSPVRASAARFLAYAPDPLSEDGLIQIALADKEETVRLAALDPLTPARRSGLHRSPYEKSFGRRKTRGALPHSWGDPSFELDQEAAAEALAISASDIRAREHNIHHHSQQNYSA